MYGVERGLESKVDGSSRGIEFKRALLRECRDGKLQRQQRNGYGLRSGADTFSLAEPI
jgi:hypothetical protein